MGVIDKDGALYFATGIDNKGLGEDAQKAIRIFEEIGEGAVKSGDKANSAIDRMKKHLDETIPYQKRVINQLKKELSELEESFKVVNVGTQDPQLIEERRKMSEAIRQLRFELQGEEEDLAARERIYEKLTAKSVTMRTELTKMTNELVRLKMEGKENTEQYRELERQAGELRNAFKDLTHSQKAFTSNTVALDGFIQGLNVLSGTITTAVGVMGALTNESDKYQKIQAKVQSMIAITIGLQQVQNALHETSVLRVHTVTRAKQMWSAAVKELAVALGISNVAAQALMATLSLGLTLVISGAIYLYDKFKTKLKETREEQQKLAETVTKNLASEISSYELLRKTYNQLGNDIKDKERFILENQSAFNKLGVSINTVNEADRVFIEQTEAFKRSIEQRARATAAMEIASEKYKEAIQKREEADNIKVSAWRSIEYVEDDEGNIKAVDRKAQKMRNEADKIDKEADKLVDKYIKGMNKSAEIIKDAGIKSAQNIAEGTKAWWEAKKQNAQARLDAMKDTQKGSEEWNSIVKEIQDADKALGSFETKKGQEKKATEDFKKLRDDVLKYEQEYQDRLKDMELSGQRAKIERMQDGYDKELALIEQSYLEELNAIDRAERNALEKHRDYEERKARLRGEKNFDSSAVSLTPGMQSLFEDMRDNADSKRESGMDKVYDKLIEKYKTYEQKRLDISKQFAEERRSLESRNADGSLDESIKLLNDMEREALAELDSSMQDSGSLMVQIFSDMSTKSIEELKKIRDEAEALFDFLSSGEWDAEKGAVFGITKEQFDSIFDNPDKLIRYKQAVDNIRDSIFKLDKPANQIKEGLKQLFNPDLAGTNKQLEGLEKVRQGYQKYADAVGLVSDTLRSLSDMSGSDLLGDIAGGIDDVLNTVDQAMKGAQIGAQIGGPAGAIVGGVIGAAKGVFEAIGKHKLKKANEEIEKNQVRIDRLKEAYEDLERAINKTYSTKAFALLEDEQRNLQAQRRLVEDQKRAENSKKKPDKGALKEYDALLKDIDNRIEETKDRQIEALTGTDMMNAIDQFAQAYADAWSSGEKAAQKSADVVKGILRNSILEYIKGEIQPKVTELMETIAEAMKDGVISEAEQDAIDAITSAIDSEAQKYKDALSPYLDKQQGGGVTGELQAAMTEGTASRLVGLWNMTAMDIRMIREYIMSRPESEKANVSSQLRDILDATYQIRDNTKATADNTGEMSDKITELNSLLDEIRRNTKTNNSRI